MQIDKKTHQVQTGLPGHDLVLLVVLPRQRKGNELAERGPAECDDSRVGRRNARCGKPFAIERRAGDGGLEVVIEAVNKDEQVAPGIGQIVHRRLAESAGRDILDLLDRAGLVGGQIGIVDKRRRIGDRPRVGRRHNLCGIASPVRRGTFQRAVCRKIDRRQHVAPLSIRGRAASHCLRKTRACGSRCSHAAAHAAACAGRRRRCALSSAPAHRAMTRTL